MEGIVRPSVVVQDHSGKRARTDGRSLRGEQGGRGGPVPPAGQRLADEHAERDERQTRKHGGAVAVAMTQDVQQRAERRQAEAVRAELQRPRAGRRPEDGGGAVPHPQRQGEQDRREEDGVCAQDGAEPAVPQEEHGRDAAIRLELAGKDRGEGDHAEEDIAQKHPGDETADGRGPGAGIRCGAQPAQVDDPERGAQDDHESRRRRPRQDPDVVDLGSELQGRVRDRRQQDRDPPRRVDRVDPPRRRLRPPDRRFALKQALKGPLTLGKVWRLR